VLEALGGGVGGVELAEQSQDLTAHCLLDEGELAHLRGAEGLAQSGCLGVDALVRPALRGRTRLVDRNKFAESRELIARWS
jgi:hypothetical protein